MFLDCLIFSLLKSVWENRAHELRDILAGKWLPFTLAEKFKGKKSIARAFKLEFDPEKCERALFSAAKSYKITFSEGDDKTR